MIVLFTDFGLAGPYVGQMKAVLHQRAPGVAQVDLFHDVCAYDARLAAYLLAAYVDEFPPQTVFLCVVDPGVGTGQRPPVMVQADGRWFVGPGNGLFNIIMKRARKVRLGEILWRPARLSNSFHGRDLFAPVAAMLAVGEVPENRVVSWQPPAADIWPDDLARVLYLDHFGNAFTGVRAAKVGPGATVQIGERKLAFARTFGEVPPGQAFWYENANGLVEIAVSQGNAGQLLQIRPGAELIITET